MNQPAPQKTWPLALAALGVVYGDIGTSPIYSLRECLAEGRFDPADPLTVLGPASLMLWSLILIVSVKYLILLTRATNQGEGGVFALLSILKQPAAGLKPSHLRWVGLFAILGAALLYGDCVITPAVTVLGAVEGLKEINPNFARYIVPAAAVILFGLFAVQRHGTHRIGNSFGPVMVVWFLALGVIGLLNVVKEPQAWLALLRPDYGARFLMEHAHHGIGIMGSVLLCVTGCEALYADIGHFGASAMRRSWFLLAYPALSLNYLGQSALVLSNPSAHESPFFRMVPAEWLVPLVILTTLASVIASQAMITGMFSLTQQAMQLGFLPRLKIKHTNANMRGQVYLPQVNVLLALGCLALVFGFKSSGALTGAYGLAVSANMVLTTLLFLIVATRVWKWEWWKAVPLGVAFLSLEISYLAGSLTKLFHGAWLPVLLTILLWLVMKTWQDGRAMLWRIVSRSQLPVEHLLREIENNRIFRVRGTGVFMSGTPEGLPLVLLHHLKHNKSLHERVVLLSVQFHGVPHIGAGNRVNLTELAPNFHRVVIHYGFVESPDVMGDLCRGLKFSSIPEMTSISFYQARELLVPTGKGMMASWRKKLFVLLSRMARPATGYFELPSRGVIELGIQIEV